LEEIILKFLNYGKHSVTQIKWTNKKDEIVHKIFELGILIKGIDGVLQVLGGILLMFFNPIRLNKLVVFITQHELSQDPNDVIVNYVINLSNSFSINAQHFGVIYLISHGLVKLILYLLLLNNKRGAYPIAIISLIAFIFYQMYRYSISSSIFMLILTFFDIIMVVLTLIEYKNTKNKINQ
jgi:uncharacterized membrane protein